jgi:hypothetical protein
LSKKERAKKAVEQLGLDKQLEGQALEVISLRTKLEQRTLFLRASLALNAGLISGLIIRGII